MQRKDSFEKKAQMKLALDAIPMAACIVDDRLSLVYANPAALAMFGYTEAELIGHHMEILKIPYFVKTDGDLTQQSLQNLIVGSALENIGLEVKAQHQDGRTLDLRLTLKTLPDQKLFVASFLDLAADVRLREMTKKHDIQKDIAERYEAACAYLSHEIRNQLYPQSVVLQEMKAGNSKQASNIDMILDANTTVTTILNQVLDFAKWQSGEFKIESILFPITRLFAAIVSYAPTPGVTPFA